MKIATWNVNSIRQRHDRVLAWLEKERPDVLCIQETKVADKDFPTASFEKAGYSCAIFGQPGYNGVAIVSRSPATDVVRGFGDEPASQEKSDVEARVLAATIEGIRIVCLYVPNGQELTSEKYPYKLAWYGRLRSFLDRTVTPTDQVIVCGDMNVTPDDRDVWAPEKWKDSIHCSPPERAALAGVVAFGLVDLFRHHHGDAKAYSWWDYRGVSFFKDQGLRIDLVYGTQPVVARCTACTIDRSARKGQDASDHAPVIATLS